MKELYLKYIDSDFAPLEINIASKQRKKIESAFGQPWIESDCKEIMTLMEGAVEEIIKLMTEAAIRFSSLDRERTGSFGFCE